MVNGWFIGAYRSNKPTIWPHCNDRVSILLLAVKGHVLTSVNCASNNYNYVSAHTSQIATAFDSFWLRQTNTMQMLMDAVIMMSPRDVSLRVQLLESPF